ncbi:MAG: hypothetical protein MIL41_20520 [Hyphomicrobiales bacterium]|jgi:hypothetical protein
MNSEYLEHLRTPSLANLRVLAEYATKALEKAKALNKDIIVTLGSQHQNGVSQSIRELERSTEKFRVLACEMTADHPAFRSNDFAAAYSDLIADYIKNEDTIEGAIAAWGEIKRELLELCKPPVLSEIITRFTSSPRQADRIIDSRADAYVRNCVKHGRRRAYMYHWSDTLKSCGPVARKFVPFAIVVEWIRRWFGS